MRNEVHEVGTTRPKSLQPPGKAAEWDGDNGPPRVSEGAIFAWRRSRGRVGLHSCRLVFRRNQAGREMDRDVVQMDKNHAHTDLGLRFQVTPYEINPAAHSYGVAVVGLG
jgi:hypothetical protein